MAQEKKPAAPKGRIHVHIDEQTAAGLYSNLVMLNHGENEFVLDFAFAPPGAQVAKVRARIVSSPRHAKRLLHALQRNVEAYERRFGLIDVAIPPPDAGDGTTVN